MCGVNVGELSLCGGLWGYIRQKSLGITDLQKYFIWAYIIYIIMNAFRTPYVYELCYALCWKPTAWFAFVYLFGCVSLSSLTHLIPLQTLLYLFCFFHHSSCCFLLFFFFCFISALLSSFFFLPTFSSPLVCHFLSLSFHPASPPTVIFIFYPLCLSLLQQNKADIVLRDRSCSNLKYDYASDCHLDVFRNFC